MPFTSGKRVETGFLNLDPVGKEVDVKNIHKVHQCLKFNVFLDSFVKLASSVEYALKANVFVPDEFKKHSFVFIPNESLLQSKKLLSPSIICNVSKENSVMIRVFCANEEDSVLRSDTLIGHLEVLNMGDGFYERLETHQVRSIKLEKEQSKFDFELGNIKDEEAKEEMRKLLQRFHDIFSQNKMDIGTFRGVRHKIDTRSHSPVALNSRRVPLAMEEKVDEMVDQLLANKIIEETHSPWNAPIVLVAKKNGDIRMCVDYRKLNSITKRPIFPIPSSQQIFDSLSGAKYFSTLDLSQGYHQIAMDDADAKKTAFTTRKGQFQFNKMPFGLSTAPATFQRAMNLILANENWHKCLIYLDDILVFGSTLEEHNARLEAVFDRIREANIKLSPSKCKFLQSEVVYLGHVISGDEVKTDPDKINAIKNCSPPESFKELKSFLGLCGYYRRFIRNYSDIISPLESLCNKGNEKGSHTSFQWEQVHQEAFAVLKAKLISSPVLGYPTREGTFVLDTDASHGCIGAVLSQVQNDREVVIAYSSKRLTKSERRYCTTRKELLAVYKFVMKHKHYLFGRKFILRTDHKSLLWLLNWKNPNTSQYCIWKAELDLFDMEVVHRKGQDHVNAH